MRREYFLYEIDGCFGGEISTSTLGGVLAAEGDMAMDPSPEAFLAKERSDFKRYDVFVMNNRRLKIQKNRYITLNLEIVIRFIQFK